MQQLRAKLEEITQLSRAQAVLSYDQVVFMPSNAAAERGQQMATLAGVVHDKRTSPRLLELMEAALSQGDLSRDDERLIELEEKAFLENQRIPSELAAKAAALSASAYQEWVQAKANSNFEEFVPTLQECFDTAMEMAKAKLGDNPDNKGLYDQMLDEFEVGMSQHRIDEIFTEVKGALVPLIEKVLASSSQPSAKPLEGTFDITKQQQLSETLVKAIGYDSEFGRIDVSVHPFTSSMSSKDVRITSRFRDDEWYQGLAGSIHEGGHAIYEQNLKPTALSLDSALSMGTHESQSLFWERHIGLSNPFWKFAHQFMEDLDESFHEHSAQDLYGAVNRVSQSLIRVEADELTYPLHVILRYGIEKDVISGKLAVKDISCRWNQDMKDLLKVDVPSEDKGALQDVHWSGLAFGYFPTYLLGAIAAAQLYHYCERDIPELEMNIEAGDFTAIKEWLRVKVHQHAFWSQTFASFVKGEASAELRARFNLSSTSRNQVLLCPERLGPELCSNSSCFHLCMSFGSRVHKPLVSQAYSLCSKDNSKKELIVAKKALTMNDLSRNRRPAVSQAPRAVASSTSSMGGKYLKSDQDRKSSVGSSRRMKEVTTATGSSTSLVSAMTVDEEAFECHHNKHTGGSSFDTNRNATFDSKPLQPVRGPSFTSLHDPCVSRTPTKTSRHFTGEVTPSPLKTPISRFDIVCQAGVDAAAMEKHIDASTAFRSLQRPNVSEKNQFAPLVSETTAALDGTETLLSKSLPEPGSKFLCTSSSQHRGQIQSMLPLSKPMRRDVSGATMSIAHKNNICTVSTDSASAHCNSSANRQPSTHHNASTWTFPPENKAANPFLLSSKLTASLLPMSKPVRQPSNCDKWFENDQRKRRDVPPQIRSVNRTKTPPVVMAGVLGCHAGGTKLQKSKSTLMQEEEAAFGEEVLSIDSTTCSSSTCSGKSHALTMSPPPRRRNAPHSRSSPFRRALRASLHRSPRKNVSVEEPLDVEPVSFRTATSGQKRPNIRGSSSTNSINLSDHSGKVLRTTSEHHTMKRLRRHSAPWVSSSKASPAKELPGPAWAESLPMPISKAADRPLGKSIKDASMASSTHTMQSHSHSNSTLDIFPPTPTTLRKTSLMRFKSSQNRNVDPMMVLPQRQDSDKFLNMSDDEEMDDGDISGGDASQSSVGPPAA
ncbi:MAG: hypothetical protein SGILL_003133 [Bacillariaceae sp.]